MRSGNQTALRTWVFSILAYFSSRKNHRDFPLIKFQKTQCNMCWWWSSLEWVTLLLQTCGSLQRSSAKSWDWITVFMGRVLIRLAALLMVADPSELCGTAGDLLISELAGVQIAIIHRSDKTVIKSVRCTIREMIKEMTNFISISDNCYCRFTH